MNAPQYYYVLAERYRNSSDLREKEEILREMISVLPKHKGTEKELAMLKRRLALLKKSGQKHRRISVPTIKKIWPRVCLLGYDPQEIKEIKFTEIGGVYYGVTMIENMHIQVVLMSSREKDPNAFDQSDIIISKEKVDSNKFNMVQAKPDIPLAIDKFGVIPVYIEGSDDAIPMPKNSRVLDLIKKLHLPIHKGMYALVINENKKMKTGLNHALNKGEKIKII